MLNGLDLFSGIGGITLALSEWVRPICYVEIEPYAQAVLQSRINDELLPAAPIWDDVRTFDGLPLRGLVDIVYGGFPCQDLSCAGSGKGIRAQRSGLFFEIMRLAEEIKPAFIFLENVPAIRTRGLREVGKELASLRYDCRWGCLSAYDVGASHIRERWFCLAYSKRNGIHKQCGRSCRESRKSEIQPVRNGKIQPVADTECQRLSRSLRETRQVQPRTNGQSWWDTEPNLGRVVNGLPFRVDRIKCLGNAVVPAQVSEAFERLIGFKK